MSTIMLPRQEEMSKLTNDLESKSEKMRVLARAGYSRGDIARFLGTSYQFVRNVLLREEARVGQAAISAPKLSTSSAVSEANSCKVRVGSEGQITLPPATQRALGLKEGDVLFVSTAEGEIYLLTKLAAVRKVQAMIRKFVPENINLVDELLEDRRREAEREGHDG